MTNNCFNLVPPPTRSTSTSTINQPQNSEPSQKEQTEEMSTPIQWNPKSTTLSSRQIFKERLSLILSFSRAEVVVQWISYGKLGSCVAFKSCKHLAFTLVFRKELCTMINETDSTLPFFILFFFTSLFVLLNLFLCLYFFFFLYGVVFVCHFLSFFLSFFLSPSLNFDISVSPCSCFHIAVFFLIFFLFYVFFFCLYFVSLSPYFPSFFLSFFLFFFCCYFLLQISLLFFGLPLLHLSAFFLFLDLIGKLWRLKIIPEKEDNYYFAKINKFGY